MYATPVSLQELVVLNVINRLYGRVRHDRLSEEVRDTQSMTFEEFVAATIRLNMLGIITIEDDYTTLTALRN